MSLRPHAFPIATKTSIGACFACSFSFSSMGCWLSITAKSWPCCDKRTRSGRVSIRVLATTKPTDAGVDSKSTPVINLLSSIKQIWNIKASPSLTADSISARVIKAFGDSMKTFNIFFIKSRSICINWPLVQFETTVAVLQHRHSSEVRA